MLTGYFREGTFDEEAGMHPGVSNGKKEVELLPSRERKGELPNAV